VGATRSEARAWKVEKREVKKCLAGSHLTLAPNPDTCSQIIIIQFCRA